MSLHDALPIYSAVYSGITGSPGATLVTPSPTPTTTPAPSWPSTTGNRPSGSAPDSVNASVWHIAVWVIFTSTSPLRGGSTSISTLCSGWSGAKATAARDFMAILLAGDRGERVRPSRKRGRWGKRVEGRVYDGGP